MAKPKRRKQQHKQPTAHENIAPETTQTEPQPAAAERNEPDTSRDQNSVLSGAVEIARYVEKTAELGPLRSRLYSPTRSTGSMEIPQKV